MSEGVNTVPLTDITPSPHNPRENFNSDKIAELADSIDKQGLIQPVLVRPNGDGYELVHGERRFRACKQLGKNTIKAEIRDLADKEALEISVTENLQREDVSPLAEARSYKQLIDEFDLTQTEAADRLGVSQAKIANQLKLLDLPETLQGDILHKILSPWQARIIGQHWEKYRLRDFAIDHDVAVKELRNLIGQLENGDEWISIHDSLPLESFETELEEGATKITENGDTFTNDGGIQDALIWLDQHGIKTYDREFVDGPHEGERVADHRDPDPVVYSWVHGTIVSNYAIVSQADMHDYDGKINTKIIFPRSFFERVAPVGGESQ